MTNQDSSGHSVYRSADFISGGLLMLLSFMGFAATFFGKWSRGAGGIGGAKLFPRVSSTVVFLTACLILAGAFKKRESQTKLPKVGIKESAVFFGLGVLCVYLTIKLGVIVGGLIYMAAAFSILTAPEERTWRTILLPAALMALANWVLFVRFGKVLIDPLFF